MNSRKFDITEAFIQALQEQQLKEFADKRQEARSHKECDNKTHQICQDIKNKQNKKVTEDIDEENSLDDIANYIKGIVDYNVTITPTGGGFSSYNVNFLYGDDDDSIMYSVMVNDDAIKDKVRLLNTLVLELKRLYRGKTFADIIREDLLNELNKIHPVNKKVTEATMLVPRGKSNKVRVPSIKGRNKKLKESIETNSKEGTCPVCHSDNIEYSSLDVDDYGVVYPFICNSCGAEGNEYYDMTFSEIIDNYTNVSSTSEGVCPKCGSDLDYGSLIPDGMDIYYEVECSNCDFVGKEWYDLSYAGQEIKNKKQEARSHKEDNERVAPRTTIRNGKEVPTRDTQKNLDNTFVGKKYVKGAVANNPYYGGQYYGTTDAEYKSKRNKTGQKRTSTTDMSKKYDVYRADTFETPVTDYQVAMGRYKDYEKTGNEDMPIAQSYKKSAQDIVNKERERIANKNNEDKKQEARSHKEDNKNATPRTKLNKSVVNNLDNQINKRNQAASAIVSNEKYKIQNKRRSLGEYKEIKK